MKQTKRLQIIDDRLDGGTLSLGCTTCALFTKCGGYTRVGGAWSCTDACNSCDRASCDIVCPTKPEQFLRDYIEIGGFGFDNITRIDQKPASLPCYVPTIQHGSYGKDSPIPLQWAAIPLNKLLRSDAAHSRPAADTPNRMRHFFGLSSNTKAMLIGTGPDQPIENYWRWQTEENLPQALRQLDFMIAVTPNFSLFSDDPRPQHLFNRKRTLLCAQQWNSAGLQAAPYIQALAEADWVYWLEFLRVQPKISIVAKEFQTSGAIKINGNDMISRLAWLQKNLGRDLHVIAIGGARYIKKLRTHFPSRWTIVDSRPFFNASYRRRAHVVGDRIRWEKVRDPDESVPDLIINNIRIYSDFISRYESRSTWTI